ncbi:MAG: DUF4402 domain-containing protein [Balneolaceae bacterium]
MKNLKVLTIAVGLLCLQPYALFAQVISDNADATVTTFVINEMNVTKLTDIDFGFITSDISTNSPLLDSENGTSSNQSGVFSIGKFEVNATNGQSIELSDNSPVTLTGPGSVTEIDFNATLSGMNGTDGSDFGGSSVNTGNSFTLTDDNYTVWVGGNLTGVGGSGGSSLTVGEHTGTYTLTVEYVFN